MILPFAYNYSLPALQSSYECVRCECFVRSLLWHNYYFCNDSNIYNIYKIGKVKLLSIHRAHARKIVFLNVHRIQTFKYSTNRRLFIRIESKDHIPCYYTGGWVLCGEHVLFHDSIPHRYTFYSDEQMDLNMLPVMRI